MSLPKPEQIVDGLWVIAAPIPGGQISHTLTYVLLDSDDRIHLIDPGWDSDENLAALESSLADLGFSLDQVASTVSTHFHPDHLGIADRLRRQVGADVLFSSVESSVIEHEARELANTREHYAETLERWGVPAERRADLAGTFDRPLLGGVVVPDRALDHGETIELGRHRLRVLATPGHTGGHICLIDDEKRIVYTGDHVLPEIFSGIGIGSLPDAEPMADYLESLGALAPYADYQALPGHEYRFQGLEQRRIQIAQHHLRRTREVRDLSQELGDAPIWEYAKRMTWTGGFDALSEFSLHSALRQTEMHLGLVRSGRAEALLD